MTLEEFMAEHERLQHAIQSAVAFELNYTSKPAEGKHLRVGVNTALVEVAGLAALLIEKGVITEQEYFAQMLKGMRAEYLKCREAALRHLAPEARERVQFE